MGGRRSVCEGQAPKKSISLLSPARYYSHRPVLCCSLPDVGSATATTSALPSSSDPIVWRPSALDAAAAASTSHDRHHQGGPHALPASTPWGATLSLHPSASPPPALHSLPHGAMQSHPGGFAYPSLATFPPLGSSGSPKTAAASAEGHLLAAAAAEERHHYAGGQPCLLVGPLGIDLAPILYGTAPHSHAGAMLSPRLLPPVDMQQQPAEERHFAAPVSGGQTLSGAPVTVDEGAAEETLRGSRRAHEAAKAEVVYSLTHPAPLGATPASASAVDPGLVPPPPQDPPPRRQQFSIQGAPPPRKQRASMSSVALNKEIMGAASTTQLLSLVRAKGHLMDYFNLSSVSGVE